MIFFKTAVYEMCIRDSIIAGSAKKMILSVPKGWTGRPTADRVKESLFNIVGNTLVDRRFLDIFSGTGNVGIEALSRGAAQCIFIEMCIRDRFYPPA